MKKPTFCPAAALILLCAAAPLQAMTVGTFRIENFRTSGRGDVYTQEDCWSLSRAMAKSRAGVIALQGVAGEQAMKDLLQSGVTEEVEKGSGILATTRKVRHKSSVASWSYAGASPKVRKDCHFFLWNPDETTMLGQTSELFADRTFTLAGKRYSLFDTPPLKALFMDNATGARYTILCLTLQDAAERPAKSLPRDFSSVRRARQIEALRELPSLVKGPALAAGSYNGPVSAAEAGFPVLTLSAGYSRDRDKSNPDGIGVIGLPMSRLSPLRETDGRIPARSTRKERHPDRDMVSVEIQMF